MRCRRLPVAFVLTLILSAVSPRAQDQVGSPDAALAGICRIVLDRLDDLVTDRWAFAELRLTTATWRDLDCAGAYGLVEPAPSDAPVRWILR